MNNKMKMVQLKEVCDVIAGQSPPSSTYNTSGIGLPFYQGKADFGEYSPNVKVWCTTPKKIAEKNDILISVRAPVGPTNMCIEQSCIGRGLSAVRCTERMSFSYLSHYFHSIEKHWGRLERGSTFSSITQQDIKDLRMPIPYPNDIEKSLAEQKKIAGILDKADEIRKKRAKAIDLANEFIKSTFLEMFGDPVNVKNPVSKSWRSMRFGDMLSIKRGYDLPKQDREVGNVPVVAANGIVGFHNVEKVIGPGVVTGRSGTLGKVMYESNNFWPLNTALYVNNFYGNNPMFIKWFLTFYRLERFTRGAGVPTLNRNLLLNIPVKCPPIELQQKFAAIVEQQQKLIEKMEQERIDAENLFNALSQKAFKGEL